MDGPGFARAIGGRQCPGRIRFGTCNALHGVGGVTLVPLPCPWLTPCRYTALNMAPWTPPSMCDRRLGVTLGMFGVPLALHDAAEATSLRSALVGWRAFRNAPSRTWVLKILCNFVEYWHMLRCRSVDMSSVPVQLKTGACRMRLFPLHSSFPLGGAQPHHVACGLMLVFSDIVLCQRGSRRRAGMAFI